jgi:phosphoribosylglycinamide formyltransferase-1
VSFHVAVLASGTGSNLQALLDRVHGHDGIEIVCVASNKHDAPALARARDAEIETGVFPAEDYPDRASRDIALADWLDEREVHLVVLAGFMEILTTHLIDRFRGRIVNVHPSLLPAFPGVRAIEQALDCPLRGRGSGLRADHQARTLRASVPSGHPGGRDTHPRDRARAPAARREDDRGGRR